MKYGKHLCRKYNKPFIPIHHMEAHALTVRLFDKNIQFPFLVLLISGGHCLISIVKDVDEFLLLGKSLDDAPGEALDKVVINRIFLLSAIFYKILAKLPTFYFSI